MPAKGRTAPNPTSQEAGWGYAHAYRAALARMLLSVGAEGAVLFSMWFLF